MHVIVIGAGIVGVTTAYCLRRHGCEVTVIDRHSGVAQEASFANGGVIAPESVGPWAAPGMSRALVAALFRRDATLQVRLAADRALWRWLRRFVGESDLDRHRINRQRMLRLALYSRELLHEAQARHAIDYECQPGLLQLYRGEQALAAAADASKLLQDQGIAPRLLTADECRALEPALSTSTALAGGLHLPAAETGNCAYFTRRLKDICEADGVRFEFNAAVQRLDIAGNQLQAVVTAAGRRRGQACVVAAGADAAPLLAAAGIVLPLLAVKGASATMPVAQAEMAPFVGVFDDRYRIAVTRLGKRLRVAGTAVFGDLRPGVSADAMRLLLKVAGDWFPAAAVHRQAQWWSGWRAMLPDGPPLLGHTPVNGLFVNVGHGGSGWALACGAAQAVADTVIGRRPAISLDGLTIERYAPSRKTAPVARAAVS